MTIKNKLKIILSCIILLSLIFGGTIYFSLQNYQKLLHKRDTATTVVLLIFQRRFLGDEYLSFPEKRSEQQWFTKQKNLEDLITKEESIYNTTREKENMARIKKSVLESKDVFNTIVATSKTYKSATISARMQQERNRLASELSIKSQETVSAATILQEINSNSLSALLQKIVILFIIIVLSFFIMLLGSFWFIWKSAKQIADRNDALSDEKTKLEQLNAKDEAILESTDEGIYGIDLEGKCILVNRATTKLVGYTKKELLGKNMHELIHFKKADGKPYPIDECPVYNNLLNGKGVRIDNEVYYRKDGSFFNILYSSYPLIVNDEKIGAVVAFSDITKEKEVDKAKTEFVSLASHQLRTPLSSINWYTEMLLNGDAGKMNSEQKKYLNEVYTANQLMVDLVNSLLNVSRIDLGTFMIEPEPVDVVEIAKSVVMELEPQIFKQKQKVSENYDKHIPKINLDKKLTRMILQNLLSNAIKYTPQAGSIDLTIKVIGKDLEISVKDTGYGIPKNQQDKIFSKLFRADNVRAKDTEGTGLGLYIIKSIVDNTGGKMWFDSVENKGTTFFVRLPLSGMKRKEGEKKLS